MGWDPKTCLHTSPQTPPSTEQIAKQVLRLTAWVSLLLSGDKLGDAGQVTELFYATIFSSKNGANNKMCLGTSLEVQWIGHHTFTAGVGELRFLHAAWGVKTKSNPPKQNKQKAPNRMCLRAVG